MNKALLISLFLFSCTAPKVETIVTSQLPVPTALMNQKEKDMIVLANAYRVAEGLKKYKTSLKLYHIAKRRVYDMQAVNVLSHDGWYLGYQESGASYYGESISYNFQSAESNIEGFHSSADHWSMFISPVFEYIAIACEGNYTCVLVARWRNYNGKKALEIKEVKPSGNVSTIQISNL